MADLRLSNEARRNQLLDAAAALVRSEGVDVLTLARVADEAGVTKPIAYNHFGTRAGLLKALYERIDEQQLEAARMMLETSARTLDEATLLLAEAYVDCVLHIGKEFGAITAALSTMDELDTLVSEGRERYAAIYLEVFERFGVQPDKRGNMIMLGVISAAEALAREVVAGRAKRREAIEAIAHIMRSVAGTERKKSRKA